MNRFHLMASLFIGFVAGLVWPVGGYSEVSTSPGRAGTPAPANPPMVDQGKRLAFAGDRMLSAIYQNCEAPKVLLNFADPFKLQGLTSSHAGGNRIQNLDQLRNSHPYLACTEINKVVVPQNISSYGDCPNTCRTPVLYDYGTGRNGQTGPQVEEVDPFELVDRRPPYFGVDCSAFLTRVTMAAGLNLVPNGENYEVGASEFTRFGTTSGQKESCFEVVDFSKTSLKEGDIVAWPNHVMMVSSVGRDPLGLEQFKTQKDCSAKLYDYDFSKLDFTIVHSAPYPAFGKVGPSKVLANEYYLSPSSGANTHRAINLIRKACAAKFSVPCPGKSTACHQAKSYANGELDTVVLRHVGIKNPACLRRPAEIRGEKCVGSCKS